LVIGLSGRSNGLGGVCGLTPRDIPIWIPIDFDYASGFDLVDGGKFAIPIHFYRFEDEGDTTPDTRVANDVVGGFLETESTVGRHFVTEDLRVSETDLAPRPNLDLVALDSYATDTFIPFLRNNLKQ